ncbi:MAG: CCA tRNA nucleotidyltransferase [Halobacteriales archaeon]
MPDAVDAVLEAVVTRVEPDADERAAMASAVEALLERTQSAIEERDLEADVLHVGSTARDTWLSDERDIDVFVRFPPTVDRDELTDRGLAVGRAVLPDGEAAYAEHPYVTGEYEGFDVDVVPCVHVEDATAAQTAVDRTPFHNAYVREHLDDDLARGVRLAKGFLRGFGAYGSDLKTRGFGGYLVELLVLEHGGVRGLFEAAAAWRPPVRYDPADHGTRAFDDPLVVVDPTDPERNVAAVVSRTNVSRLQHHARAFLADPAVEAFEVPVVEPIDPEALRAHLERRDTRPLAVAFDRPDLLDDQLYPQLRRTREGLVGTLERAGFDVLRSAVLADDDRAVVLLEAEVAERAAVERHAGPPVDIGAHADRFLERYRDDETVYGPFVDGERYVVERDREFTRPEALLAPETIGEAAHGQRVGEALAAGFDLLVGDELAALLPRFGADLAAYFDPQP